MCRDIDCGDRGRWRVHLLDQGAGITKDGGGGGGGGGGLVMALSAYDSQKSPSAANMEQG